MSKLSETREALEDYAKYTGWTEMAIYIRTVLAFLSAWEREKDAWRARYDSERSGTAVRAARAASEKLENES